MSELDPITLRFPTTQWSQVGRAADADPAVRRQALEALLRRYLPAFRAHLRVRRRLDPHRAEDLLQGFVCDQIVADDLIARADRGRGRFRSLLLKALDRYAHNAWRHDHAAGRAPDGALLDVDALPAEPEAGGGDGPPDAFDAAWAREVVGRAVGLVREHFQQAPEGRRTWDVFRCRVLEPAYAGAPPPPYEQLVAQFGFASPSQASNALMTAKRAFARALRAVVGEYAADEAEVDAELADLWAAFARGGPSAGAGEVPAEFLGGDPGAAQERRVPGLEREGDEGHG